MKIQQNAVVSIEYVLRDDAGEIIDQSGEAPLAYLHGHGNIVPGLEKALEGLEAGAEKKTTVAPAEGYGERNEHAVMTLPKSELPDGVEPQVGMGLSGRTPDGQPIPLWISEIHESSITLDGNHPLAGRTLDFSVTVRDVRDATEEELAHGHVHGPGGHAH